MSNPSTTKKWPNRQGNKEQAAQEAPSFFESLRAWLNASKLKRGSSEIGQDVFCFGQFVLKNKGRLMINERTVIRSDFQKTRLAIGKQATLEIGKNCFLNSVIIAANHKVKIGDDCRFGPFVHLMDSDFHDLNDRAAVGKSGPIIIGNGVQLGTRVIVLRGITIGDNAVVLPGAVVTKNIPPNTKVAGVPAKEIPSLI